MNATSQTKIVQAGSNDRCPTLRKASHVKILLMNPKASALAVTKSFVFLLFFVGFYMFSTGNARASVFDNGTKWDPDPDGVTRITVCIVPGSSSVEQKVNLLIHDPNPDITEVIDHVRYALATSWERYSSVQFIGWRYCDKLSASELSTAVSLYIAPQIKNWSQVGKNARGAGTIISHTIQFAPWGGWVTANSCYRYNLASTHMEYHFECVEQYAIHEFGHAIGFLHEWRHPARPASCVNRPTDEGIVPQGSYATSYRKDKIYTINYPGVYDWESIMTYDSECAGVTGVRFGSENLSNWDIENVRQIYPRPQGRSNGPISKLSVAVAEEMKWMAWNVAWYTAHSRMGSAPSARKHEFVFNLHAERMKNNAVNPYVSPQTLENIRWFAYHAAWSTANGRVGYTADAAQSQKTAEAHFQAAKNSGELTNELFESIHKMGWAAAWYAANSMKGYDTNGDAKAFEAAYQQIIGNAVASAGLASDDNGNDGNDTLSTTETTTAPVETNRMFLPLIANTGAAIGELNSTVTTEATTELVSAELNVTATNETMVSGAESNRIYLPLIANSNT